MKPETLTRIWFDMEEPTLKVAAYKPLPDMVDKLVLYFQTVRMKPRDMLRNMLKDPLSADSVIKLMQLGLRKTGWAKMWWPKKDADWQILMKAVADSSW